MQQFFAIAKAVKIKATLSLPRASALCYSHLPLLALAPATSLPFGAWGLGLGAWGLGLGAWGQRK